MKHVHEHRSRLERLHLQEAGEGVISAAIAVLVMAFLGAGMWLAFDQLFDETKDTVTEQVREIGQ